MSENKLPDDMYRKGRPVDPVFQEDECLYIRISGVDNHKKPNLLSITFNEQSANRSKYSEIEWVLLPNWTNWGIISIRVKNVQIKLRTEGNNTFSCDAVHVPLEDNYSHSEIRTSMNGEFRPRKKINNKYIKQQIRTRLIECCEVLKLPDKEIFK